MERKPFDEEELFHYLMTEEERVAKLSLEELEKYMREQEAIAKFLWPGEKDEHPRWLLELLEKKKKEAQALSNDTADSLKTSGQDKRQEN